MPYCSESLKSDRAARCAVCDGKFGLVRHYSWRIQLCSRKCVDRYDSITEMRVRRMLQLSQEQQ